MEIKNHIFRSNPDKNVLINFQSRSFARDAIRTHFVKPKDDYIEIIKQHVSSVYENGDILSISEKIIALCQNRIVYKSNIKLSFWSKFLSKFVKITPAGEAVGNPYKMQLAIESAGLIRILFAAACSAITKLFGIKGVFYKIAGNGVAGIDGFCNDAFEDYLEMGILNPENPGQVCEEIKDKLGIECMIVDANDFNVEILGKSSGVKHDIETLKAMLRDNPSGQGHQQTPLILIREIENDAELTSPAFERSAQCAVTVSIT